MPTPAPRLVSLALLLSGSFLVACTTRHEPAAPAASTASGSAAARTEQPAAPALAPGEPETPLPVESDDARVGAPEAAVTLVAFLDFESPDSKKTFESLLDLAPRKEELSLRIVVKHLPLEGHAMALPTAIAAQAVADRAGSAAFFEFSKRAFDAQDHLDYALLAAWAEEVGVPRSVYDEAVSSEETLMRVATDARLGSRIGSQAPPRLYANGRALAPLAPLAEIEKAIAEERLLLTNGGGPWRERYAARVRENVERTLVQELLAEDPQIYRVPVDTSPSLGPRDARVTLVLFTDYQCPYCKRADATIAELLRRHPQDLRLVWKNMPLPGHERALPAARLALAVRAARGDAAFFSVSSELFEKNPHLDADVLGALGRKHGLSATEIERATSGENQDIEAAIAADRILAGDIEARGTPLSFVNGRRLEGARPFAHFEALFHAEFERAERLLGEGASGEGLYAALQKDGVQPGAPRKLDRSVPSQGRPSRGPDTAPVTVHVFSDFQCPYCRYAESTLAELESSYPGQLRLVWHDHPLDFHELARPAARAGREALRQGGSVAFWRLHDAMFAANDEAARVTRADLLEHARKLGLNLAAFERAIDTSIHDQAIDQDIQLATSLGFKGTPTFVVGGYAVLGARDVRHFKRLVDLALADASQKASGTGRGGQ